MDILKQLNTIATPTTTLFIGKFMPFHEGHKLILDTLIESGDKVKLGIKRDIKSDELKELKKELKDIYGFDIEIVELGWFDRIGHGRGTGYAFDRIPTPKDMEVISSSKIRTQVKRWRW